MAAKDPSFQLDEMGLSRVEYAYRKIKENVTTNIYPAGFQELEPELAKKLGISRTPVREALIRLEADKLIQLIPRRGMRVNALSAKDILEISDVFTGLISSVARFLCRTEESVDFSELESSLHSFKESLSNVDDQSAILDAEEAVWLSAVALTGNARLKLTLKNLLEQIRRVKVVSLSYGMAFSPLATAASKTVTGLRERDLVAATEGAMSYSDELISGVTSIQEQYSLPGF